MARERKARLSLKHQRLYRRQWQPSKPQHPSPNRQRRAHQASLSRNREKNSPRATGRRLPIRSSACRLRNVRDREEAIIGTRDARATLALARPLNGCGAWARLCSRSLSYGDGSLTSDSRRRRCFGIFLCCGPDQTPRLSLNCVAELLDVFAGGLELGCRDL